MKSTVFSGFCALSALFALEASASAQCYTDRVSWLQARPGPVVTEDFSGFAADTPFDAGPLGIATGTIEAINGLGFRNVVDVPPFMFGDNNGTNHASCFTNQDAPETFVEFRFPGSIKAWGGNFSGAIGGEVAEVRAYAGGTLILVCSIASNDIDQWAGFDIQNGRVNRVTLNSVNLNPGGGGEGFGLDDVSTKTDPGVGGGTCYSDINSYLNDCGAPTNSEDFSAYGPNDIDFNDNPTPINIGVINAPNGTLTAFRNVIDVPPFLFGDNNGTNHASCFTNQDEPVEVHISLQPRVKCFGAAASGATSGEVAEMAVFSGGVLVDVCQIASNDIDQFVGYSNEDCLDLVVFRSVNLNPGGGGEGFSLDNFIVSDCNGPIGQPLTACNTQPNSTNVIARTRAIGSTSIGADRLTLIAEFITPGQFGYFIGGPNPANFSPPQTHGFVCIGAPTGRYNAPPVGQGPVIRRDIGTGPIPTGPPATPLIPGNTYYWQCWYRDPAAGPTPGGQSGNNFSSTVCIQFVP